MIRTERQGAIRFIVAMGVVSFFADMTYEGAHSIIGPLLKDLGATATQVGIVAGLGEMIAATLRVLSGRLADKTRAYWTITTIGYFVNLVVVPGLAFAGSWKMAALFVVAERTGKGLRGPAKDVLLSDATRVVGHGWGFGLHTAMDQMGAVLGPLLIALVVAREHSFGPAILWLVAPAIAAFIALIGARAIRPTVSTEPQTQPHTQKLPNVFWFYVAGAGLLAGGFVDFPLLAYHFQNTAIAQPAAIPLFYAGAMGLNGLAALFFGRLFDRFGIRILTVGIVVSMLSLPLGFLGGPTMVIVGVACWAIGLGAQQATLRAGIAQLISMDKRGSAYGVFNAVYGVLWFFGSVSMGMLYDYSLITLVVFGVTLQIVSAAIFLWLHRPLSVAMQNGKVS
ncbi:MAG TPA: MFS transporter [Pyrinomonadaceae bacterium]|nr:MFS transporter [Pyrinomonadaceae bacterium]